MSEKMYCDPAEILEVTVQKGIAKASTSIWKLLCLGFLCKVFATNFSKKPCESLMRTFSKTLVINF